jgi:hypothetical protein
MQFCSAVIAYAYPVFLVLIHINQSSLEWIGYSNKPPFILSVDTDMVLCVEITLFVGDSYDSDVHVFYNKG